MAQRCARRPRKARQTAQGALAGAAFCWILATPALASQSPWSGAVILQADIPLAGAVAPGAAGFSKAYGPSLLAAVELQRRTGEQGEVFIAIAQASARGETFAAAGGAPASARLTSLRAASLELGYRRRLLVFFAGVQPSLAIRAGLVRTDAIAMALRPSQAGAAATSAGLTRDTTALMLGAELGLAYQIGRASEISADIGLRYAGPLLRDRSAGIGAGGGPDGRLSLPVGVRLTTRF
jgi:hypothetical protein